MRDDREFQRIDVLIPCLIYCDDRVITGDIINLSLSGALIQASETLAEGSPVVLTLQKKQDIKLRATVDSTIIHSFKEVGGDDPINSFGVRFEESLSEVTDKLDFILHE
ncbi:MAG: PilZ domain-containing protein [Acidobacteriota bacterium]